MRKNPHYASLLKVLRETGQKIQQSVILTYEFDPQLAETLANDGVVAFNGTEDGSSMLCWFGAFPSVLFFDPTRTQATKRLPGNFQIHFWKRGPFRCHHAKAYSFLLSDGSAELILGSFNFTPSGFFRNRETLLRFRLCTKDVSQRSVFLQWRDILQTHYVPRASHSKMLQEYLNGLNHLLEETASSSPNTTEDFPVHLIFSGNTFEKTGFDSLKKLLSQAGLTDLREMVCVSPFFDGAGANQKIFAQILESFPNIDKVNLFSDIADDKWNSAAFPGSERISLKRWQISQKIDKTELENLSHELGEDINRKFSVLRSLHAKILLLRDHSDKALLYTGSANFTAKAWLGGNVELGAAMILPKWPAVTPKLWVKQFFGIGNESIHLVKQPMTTEACAPEDPEDAENLYFPDELESIELQLSSSDFGEKDGRFAFSVRMHDDKPASLAGEFYWGELALKLQWSAQQQLWVSQTIGLEYIRKELLHRRSVELRRGILTTSIPFNISSELCITTDLRFSTTPENSLSFLASILTTGIYKKQRKFESTSKSTESKNRKGSAGTVAISSLSREDNTVIRMQRWIESLNELERALFEPTGAPRAAAWRSDLPTYFNTVTEFILRDTSNTAAAQFQCGEILLLASRLVEALRAQGWKSKTLEEAWTNAIANMTDFFSTATEGNRKAHHGDKLPSIYETFVKMHHGQKAERI